MSKKSEAVFIKDNYYLLPDGITSVNDFKKSIRNVPTNLTLRALTENNHINSWNIEKGVCIAPYFYSEYGYEECDVAIDHIEHLYPVDIELFTQKEYNQRLREAILSYCPGCLRYKPISNRVQSLNGHFEEITLNSVCFFRQDSKPAPRVFRDKMMYFGGSMYYHFDPREMTAKDAAEFIKSETYLKFDTAVFDESAPSHLHVSVKPDFFSQNLSAILESYIEKKLDFTDFRLILPLQKSVDADAFNSQISTGNREKFQKNCKKYGVSLAELSFDPAFEMQVLNTLDSLIDHFYAVVLFREIGKLYFMVLDECGFLKGLHFRAPILDRAGTTIKIWNQYEEKSYRISFQMERI